ncbi:conserved oligomeric golgi complex subunit 2 [Lichtheimia corymbifera JMRC:FSU:9682]|uniref:Conserved oligomeric Golgi complex subunit 2 n=1 Tax=Lichtheimia corymbifera JMRC:FSU:9682 TaxID=1263082 RepID=A0A068RY81_9FUNG|nr:conserved oligomeric golgi complex subunit 2 [Lichtheimia corymbifera JMRC:FSU:9682]
MTNIVKQHDRKRPVFSFQDEDDEDGNFTFEPLTKDAVDRAAFIAPNFDTDRFLASRRHLGLERLKVEFNNHLKFLKTELIELINRDYQDFIDLSTNLKGVDKAISNIRGPLKRMEHEALDIRINCQSSIDQLESQLLHRAELREKKTCLKLMLNIHESVTKVEDLLEINTDTPAISVTSDESLGKQIERVAIEYNQMQHLVKRGKHLPFMAENEWRITRIKDTLQSKLSRTLESALRQLQEGQPNDSTKQSLIQCLRTYALIDQTQVAEWLIREQFVRPFVEKTITHDALADLTTMYSKLLSFASGDLQPILDITQKNLKGTTYEILVNSFWVEVIDRLNRHGSSIYAPGQTDAFHKSYTASISFVSSIENICTSRKSLICLRSHPRYSEFMKRWQLPVYFQLRFREIVKNVEDLLNNPTGSTVIQQPPTSSTGGGDSGEQYHLAFAGTRAISQAIEKCWSDHIFLYSLSHRFWKLTLQLTKRYSIWATGILQHILGADKTNQGKATSPSKPSNNDESISTSQLVILSHDVDAFIQEVKSRITKIIAPKLPDVDLSMLRESMDTILDELAMATVAEIQFRVVRIVSRRCSEALNHVPDISGQYRYTNKPPPTEPSAFISKIFQPYTEFTEQNTTWIDSDKQELWGRLIAENVVNRYMTSISDLLTSLRKMENSLKKIKKSKKSTQSSLLNQQPGRTMSDEDKIRLQILLDVRQLGEELSSLSIDKHAFKLYGKLYEIVKPFESLEAGPPDSS